MNLTHSQRLALVHVTDYAATYKEEARQEIREILQMANIASGTCEAAIDKLKAHARIAMHFHPDRPDPMMRSVAEAMLQQGLYKSQFETLLSSGSVTAYPGGARDQWEQRLFGGAYPSESTAPGERPKYGALNLMLHPDGPAPRFGSCYFLLAPEVTRRATFTYMDSHDDPQEKGTLAEFDMILAALLKEIFLRDSALGEKDLTPRKFFEHLLARLDQPFPDPAGREPKRNLNHYIEAQVHGDISLEKDVEALVADPSFKNAPVGETLERLCRRYSIKLYWHQGFALPVEEVPSDFRGPAMPSLARRIARQGLVDVRLVGEAAMDLKRDPAAWSDRGTYAEVLQELKLMWHVLVKYGKPFKLP